MSEQLAARQESGRGSGGAMALPGVLQGGRLGFARIYRVRPAHIQERIYTTEHTQTTQLK